MKNELILPPELDSPGKQHIGVGIIYSFFAFFSLPFLTLLFSGGSGENITILSILEMVYHILNCSIFFAIFKELITDSWFLFRINWKSIFAKIKYGVLAMVGVAYLWYAIGRIFGLEIFSIAVYGTLPITELDVLFFSTDLVYAKPVIGFISTVLLAPFAITCAFYAVGFVPAFNVRPWFGYLMVAVVTAFPTICNALTYWDPTVEIVLYIARLPLHMIACRVYQKTENIWAPIFCLMLANLIAFLRLLILLLLGQ